MLESRRMTLLSRPYVFRLCSLHQPSPSFLLALEDANQLVWEIRHDRINSAGCEPAHDQFAVRSPDRNSDAILVQRLHRSPGCKPIVQSNFISLGARGGINDRA